MSKNAIFEVKVRNPNTGVEGSRRVAAADAETAEKILADTGFDIMAEPVQVSTSFEVPAPEPEPEQAPLLDPRVYGEPDGGRVRRSSAQVAMDEEITLLAAERGIDLGSLDTNIAAEMLAILSAQ